MRLLAKYAARASALYIYRLSFKKDITNYFLSPWLKGPFF